MLENKDRNFRRGHLASHKENVSTEVFVHGSYCISFSGICYMSSVHGNSSGNRGRCSQPCRKRYASTPQGKDFPLNLKDNSAYFDLKRLADAGVDAMKIEGRMKAFHYVYTVTNAYKRRLNSLNHRAEPVDDSGDLYKVFNRDFSNAFLVGNIDLHMFSDHPRNYSATHLQGNNRSSRAEQSTRVPPKPQPTSARNDGDFGDVSPQPLKKSAHGEAEKEASSPHIISTSAPTAQWEFGNVITRIPPSMYWGVRGASHEICTGSVAAIEKIKQGDYGGL